MTSAHQRAVQGYAAWEPIATQAFDLLLRGKGHAFGVAATYDRGMFEDNDDPQGWLDDGDHPMDMDGVSAHARLAYASIQASFGEGIKGWMEPLRTISRTHGLRLYVNVRFERMGDAVQPWFHFLVEPGEVVVEGATLRGALAAFEQALSEHFA